MKRILLLFFIISTVTAEAQTHIKANTIYWLALMPNAAVETRLSDHFTLSGEVFHSPWKSINGNPLQFIQFNPDMRYYPKGSFKGFYIGAYSSIQDYKLSKWNYWNTIYYQKGWGYGFGGMIGFQTMLTDRWGLDVYAGGGWHFGHYRGFYKNSSEMYVDWNSSGEWLPYRLAISVCYKM